MPALRPVRSQVLTVVLPTRVLVVAELPITVEILAQPPVAVALLVPPATSVTVTAVLRPEKSSVSEPPPPLIGLSLRLGVPARSPAGTRMGARFVVVERNVGCGSKLGSSRGIGR